MKQGIGNRESGMVQARFVSAREANHGFRVPVSSDACIEKYCIVDDGIDHSLFPIPHSRLQ